KKLIWYNEHYLREKSADELWPRVREIAKEYGVDPDEKYMKEIIPLMKDRVSKVEDFVTMGRFFFEDPQEYEEQALEKWKDGSAEILQAYLEEIEPMDESDFKAKKLKDKIKEVMKAQDIGFGQMMMLLRVAVSGKGHGPALTPPIELLGKAPTIHRMERASGRS